MFLITCKIHEFFVLLGISLKKKRPLPRIINNDAISNIIIVVVFYRKFAIRRQKRSRSKLNSCERIIRRRILLNEIDDIDIYSIRIEKSNDEIQVDNTFVGRCLRSYIILNLKATINHCIWITILSGNHFCMYIFFNPNNTNVKKKKLRQTLLFLFSFFFFSNPLKYY